jgi:protein TonB
VFANRLPTRIVAVTERSARNWRAGGAWLCVAALAACSTKPTQQLGLKPGESPVAEAKAAAAGREPEVEPPRVSDARTVDGYKRDAARRIYFKTSARLFDGAPPPTLKSVVILSIRLDADGRPLRVDVVRSNAYRDLEEAAIKSVHDAAPLPVPRAALLVNGALEYVETWLFRDDDRFQIRSLAQVQQMLE